MNITFLYSDDYQPSAPVITIKIYGPGKQRKAKRIQALLDTGADATLLPVDILRQIGASFMYVQRMRGVMGTSYPVDIYALTIEIGSQIIRGIRAIAIKDGNEEPIIGRDVINRLKITLNGPLETLEIIDPDN